MTDLRTAIAVLVLGMSAMLIISVVLFARPAHGAEHLSRQPGWHRHHRTVPPAPVVAPQPAPPAPARVYSAPQRGPYVVGTVTTPAPRARKPCLSPLYGYRSAISPRCLPDPRSFAR